ncbi:alpha/beta-hydrolase family protein [Nocardia vermiculata]|nr:alpha/beta-hydrolase family protein [Nocardia vermiculata]
MNEVTAPDGADCADHAPAPRRAASGRRPRSTGRELLPARRRGAPWRRGLAVLVLLGSLVAVVAPSAGAAAADDGPSDTRHAATTEDASAGAAVRALTSTDPSRVVVPPDFAASLGYLPATIDGSAANPSGECSSPVALPAEFDTACKAHDLGYDLLRYADRHGGALGPWARKALDRTLEQRMVAACADRDAAVARLRCTTMAAVAAAAVDLNSLRQHYAAPRPEQFLGATLSGTEAGPRVVQILAPLAMVLLMVAALFAIVRRTITPRTRLAGGAPDGPRQVELRLGTPARQARPTRPMERSPEPTWRTGAVVRAAAPDHSTEVRARSPHRGRASLLRAVTLARRGRALLRQTCTAVRRRTGADLQRAGHLLLRGGRHGRGLVHTVVSRSRLHLGRVTRPLVQRTPRSAAHRTTRSAARQAPRSAARRFATLCSPRVGTIVAAASGIAVSLAPGLLPRTAIAQAILTALLILIALAAAGVGRKILGYFGVGTDRWARHRRAVVIGSTALVSTIAGYDWYWQNRLRGAMDFPALGPWYWLHWAVGVVAVLVPVMLFARGLHWAAGYAGRLPTAAAIAVTVLAGQFAVLPALVDRQQSAFAAADTTMDPTVVQPVSHSRSGSADSEVSWASLGAEGRKFVSDKGSSARVYIGLDSAPDLDSRIALALREIERAGGFRRGHLVLMIPTGSGWLDAKAAHGLDERFGGDATLVGMQYSKAPSWVTFLFAREDAERSARELFTALESRLATMDRPPELFVYGQSLGATAGSAIFAGDDDERSRVCAALWAGPPAAAVHHGGATVLANSSDPVVQWSPQLLWRAPDLTGTRTDAPHPPWLPVVSWVQTTADMLSALAPGPGHGHRYGTDQGTALGSC